MKNRSDGSFSPILFNTEMFLKRVGNNLGRYKSLRNKTFSAAEKYLKNRNKKSISQ